MSTQPRVEAFPRSDRLESWKEIAAYLNRSERTVRRWEEKEGLPVHRLHHDKRGSIYAYASELDAWRESRQQLIAAEPAEAGPQPDTSRRRWRWAAAGLVVSVAALLGGFLFAGRRTPETGTNRPEARRAYQLAAFAGNAGRTQIESGIRYYQEAVRLDPAFANAWSGLAMAHLAQTFFAEVPPRDTMAQAEREARRALQLDPSLSSAWTALAFISHFGEWDHAAAEHRFRKAIELQPTLSVAHSWFAECLLDLRRFDEAAAYARRAQDASPRWLEPIAVAGNIHLFTGHPELAIAEYQRALAIEPNFGLANHFLGRAYLAKGEHKRAIDQLRKSNELLGNVPFSIGELGYALGVAGFRVEAERMLLELAEKRERGFYPAISIAVIHLGLGNRDATLKWLERAADERHVGYYFPSVDPMYDPLRSDPRFQAFMRRMNLPH